MVSIVHDIYHLPGDVGRCGVWCAGPRSAWWGLLGPWFFHLYCSSRSFYRVRWSFWFLWSLWLWSLCWNHGLRKRRWHFFDVLERLWLPWGFCRFLVLAAGRTASFLRGLHFYLGIFLLNQITVQEKKREANMPSRHVHLVPEGISELERHCGKGHVVASERIKPTPVFEEAMLAESNRANRDFGQYVPFVPWPDRRVCAPDVGGA
jgi:hypothetical protein